MGKALAVSAAMVLIIGIVAATVMWLNRREPTGDLNLKEEREILTLLHSGAGVMRSLGNAHNNIDDNDVMSIRSQRALAAWLTRYDNYNLKREHRA